MYHYGANNPVKYKDPNGREDVPTDDSDSIFKNAINTAIHDIKLISKEIKSKKIADNTLRAAKEFLGKDLNNKSDRKDVLAGLQKIQKSLKGIKEIEIDETSDAYAYVYPSDSKKVYIGNAFSKATDDGFDTKSGVFVHEASHFYKGLKTKDIVYGIQNAMQLTIDSQTDAFNNADNWEYFYESSRR